MDALVYHNDKIVEVNSAKVSATLAGLQYGWGIFTTLQVHNRDLFAFDRHWDRLVKHAEKARISIPLEKSAARQALDELTQANSVVYGRVRLTVIKGGVGPWQTGQEKESEVLFFTSSESSPRKRQELSLTLSPYRILSSSPLAGVKRTSMLENLLAFDEARGRKFDEAVMLNERGEIVSATAGNIFWSDGKELFTPSLSTGCIAGITRAIILDAARRINIHAVEGSFPIQILSNALEVFVTSTARNIATIKNFDIKSFDARPGSMTRNIHREFQKLFA